MIKNKFPRVYEWALMEVEMDLKVMAVNKKMRYMADFLAQGMTLD